MVLLLRLIELSKGKGGRSTPRDTITDWEDYNSYAQIVGYLDEVAATYDFCSTEVIGQSVEGRDLKVLKFERAGPGAKNVWIEASAYALMNRLEQIAQPHWSHHISLARQNICRHPCQGMDCKCSGHISDQGAARK